jgi:hypothetical protein
VPLLLAVVVAVLAVIALIPLSLVLRYRAGTSRRRARNWLVTVNAAGLAISVTLFLISAAITNIWVADAFTYTLAGLLTGCVLGAFGLWLTRWEAGPGALHYTPNRWLVLTLTLVVAARLIHGFWRAWHTWRAGPGDTSWAVAAAIDGSLAAGAVVLGYYFFYWWGVRRRLASHAGRR